MTALIQTSQFASLPNGIRLHYASAGEKGQPLILFLHGFPEFWYEWEAQLKEFGANHFAVAPDLRGFNLSDMPADVSAYKAKHVVDDLRLLAAHLGYENSSSSRTIGAVRLHGISRSRCHRCCTS